MAPSLMGPVPLVAFTRGALVESVHYGSIAVVDSGGRLVASVGDADRVTTLRSAAKPFQAMTVLETGAADRFSASQAEIALIAGSHTGEPRHTEAVAGMLQRAGLSPEALLTGIQPPFHEATRQALLRSGQEPSPLHHNCSGKHCGMLWACVHHGWDERTYFRPDHPLQRGIFALLSDCTGCAQSEIVVGIDGCGVPSFGLPLAGMATGFARLADETRAGSHATSAQRVRDAMVAHPHMVGGEGRLDTALIAAGRGRLVSKAGAEGCQGVALLDRGWGIALKVEDGAGRAASVATAAVLRQMDVLADTDMVQLGDYARPAVRNYRGEIVGEGRAVFRLAVGS